MSHQAGDLHGAARGHFRAFEELAVDLVPFVVILHVGDETGHLYYVGESEAGGLQDIGLMLDSAKQLNVPLPLTALTHQLFQAAISTGHADEDICSTIKVLEGMAGVEVKRR